MKLKLSNIIHSILVVVFICSVSNELSAAEKRSIKFSFSPGENISFIEKLTMIKEKDMGEHGKQIDESIITSKITITRTKSGWDVLAEPLSVSLKRNGEAIDDRFIKLISSAVVTSKLDAQGNIVDVEGYQAFVEGLSKQMPEPFSQRLSSVLNVEMMKAKEIASWKGRIGDFVGAEVEVGDSFVGSEPFELPNGVTINFNVKTNISAIEPCGQHECVRIEQVYDSRTNNVAKVASNIVSNVLRGDSPETSKENTENGSATIHGMVQRIIDPHTMLIYAEESTRTVNMMVDIPGVNSVPMSMTETRVYEYQYQQ